LRALTKQPVCDAVQGLINGGWEAIIVLGAAKEEGMQCCGNVGEGECKGQKMAGQKKKRGSRAVS
jgi:hypothetical protein